MGAVCTAPRPVRPSREMLAKEGNIQDNARSYKSKISGMRLVLRNITHRRDFIKYLGPKKRFIEVFDELVNMKQIKELEPLRNEVKKLLNKYPVKKTFVWDKNVLAIGACLEPIRFYDDEVLTVPMIVKNIQWAEESVLAGVTAEFEQFIQTSEFTRRGTVRFESQGPLLSTSISSSHKEDVGRITAGTRSEPVDNLETSIAESLKEDGVRVAAGTKTEPINNLEN